jgi:hypothetical protein
MKKLMLLVSIMILTSCTSETAVQVKYVPVHDTVDVENTERIIALQRQLDLTRDSLSYVKDSLGEDLFVAKYKLGRIKYYTEIVDNKPSQIKFYKGWIKRVLNN